MKRLMLLAVVLCQPGCSLGTTIVHNICSEAKLATEEAREKKQNRRLADQAWEAKCQADWERVFSDDYRQGFRDGFMDYLEAGGNGLPPSLPPQHYWATRYQTPEGQQAIDDWYAGFRAGSAAAQESGQRELITLPTPRRPVEVTVERAPSVIAEPTPPAAMPTKPVREAPPKTPPAASPAQPPPKAITAVKSVSMTPVWEIRGVEPGVAKRPALPSTPSEGVVILPTTAVEERQEQPRPRVQLGSPTTEPPPSLDLPRITTSR